MKPDSPGLWVSEEGHVAFVYLFFGQLHVRACDKNGDLIHVGGPLVHIPSELPDCRWQKVDAPKPEFPEPKPPVVYARTPNAWGGMKTLSRILAFIVVSPFILPLSAVLLLTAITIGAIELVWFLAILATRGTWEWEKELSPTWTVFCMALFCDTDVEIRRF